MEPGPRDYQWRADVPSTLVWVVAADGGLPKKGTSPDAIVDRVMALPAPFEGEGTSILEANMRIAGRGSASRAASEWGNDHLAIVNETRFSDRKTQMIAFDPSAQAKPPSFMPAPRRTATTRPAAPSPNPTPLATPC